MKSRRDDMTVARGKRGTSAAPGTLPPKLISLSSLGGEGRGEEAVRAASNPFTGKTNQPLQATPDYACLLFLTKGPPRLTRLVAPIAR